MEMRNITVTVDEETYRRSRIRAAELGTSVSAAVRSFLVRFGQGEDPDQTFRNLERLQAETLAAIRARGGGVSPRENLTRDEVHERDAVR
jgi:plasmid stability protein